MKSVAPVFLVVAVQLAQAGICNYNCAPLAADKDTCLSPNYNTCSFCVWVPDSPPTCQNRADADPTPLCADCDRCIGDAPQHCPNYVTQVACEKLNDASCTVCGWSNGKCAISASACSKTCKGLTTKTSCDSAASACSCTWDASQSKCDTSPAPTLAPNTVATADPTSSCCANCIADALQQCPNYVTEPACKIPNTASCTLCGWSNGKCAISASACSKTCKGLTTKTSCDSAASACSCTWDSSESQCETSLESVVEEGLKLFLIIIIVTCVVAVLIIVACIVCCCCMGASAASAMSSSHKGAIIDSEMHNC